MRINLLLFNAISGSFSRSIVVLFFLFGASLSLRATDFIVTNGNNTGIGSLRQAIVDANANAAVPHTITFSVSGVINITTSLPTITRQVTIDGGNTVTISGPGANNSVALFVFGAGSGGSIVRNLTMRNTGIEPIRLAVALNNITIENMVLTQTGPHYMNKAIWANTAVTNMIIRNVVVTALEDKGIGIHFGGNVTNVMIDGYKLSGGGGLTARGIHVQGVTNGLTIKNSLIDLNDPATADDGDYGIVFAGAASNVTIDSSTFRANEINAIHCAAAVINFNIKNSTFDNLDGWVSNKFVYFKTNTTSVTMDKNIFNADIRNSANDGDYGVMFEGAANQTTTITNNQFIENDAVGIYFGNGGLANNHDNVLIQGNTFTRNGSGNNAQGGIDFVARNVTSDGGPVLITENTFTDNNGNAIIIHPGNAISYVVPNFTVSKNIIYNTKSVHGAVRLQYIDKIIITQNSIYNNQGLGIELLVNTAANCGYEGANTPQIISSVETTPGTYDVTVKMPTICGTGNCSLELFSNEAGTKGVGGQHYVTTKTGLSSGNNLLTGITGIFPEITDAPYGTWSATLKLNNNCGTSEFGNKKAIKPNGPAGINNGIALWLRGDEVSVNNAEPTASGQVITGWEEFSGGGGPSATTIVNNPLTKLNGINFNPVADMDGDVIRGVFPNAPSWITAPTTTSVAVFNPQSISAVNDRFFVLFSQSGVDYNTNHAQIEWFRTGSNNIQSYRGNTLLNPPVPGTTGVRAFDRPGVFSSVTTATNHTGYYNGASMGSGNYSKGNFAISQWFVGGGWGPNPNGNGTNTWYYGGEVDFAEVFTYNRALAPGELQKVQSYMALKYGIAMKQNYILSDSTTIWNVTTNAAYSKEIAALARDNISVLHQKQAKAFHADEMVTIALGSAITATNNDKAESITNNLSVFMWGNDSLATTYTQAFTAGTYSTLRMPRVWKVQKTNWADQNITIKVNGAKANNYLLISTDPTFASIGQELQLSSQGTITLSSSLVANGSYFTFGRQQKAPGGVANNLSVWTKADEGVTMTGTNVTAWEDQSPSQRVWPKVNATTLPWNASVMNYNPALQIAGNTYFSVPSFTNTYTQGEVFSVQSSAVNNVASFPWQLGGSSGSVGVVYRWTDNNMYLHFGTNARRNFSFGTKNMALPVILNVNSASNSWATSLDGKIMLGPSAFTTSFAQTSGLTTNYIGAGLVSTFNGSLPEVILYNRKLNDTERKQVNSYLAIRYGITLDQTTPTDYLSSDGITTMWKASDNTGYANNIAGIGYDETGSLYQKQSRSINTAANGNLIAVAAGNAIAVSNADNTDTIPNNRSFLVWGDNNGAITYTTTVTGNNVTVRMPRVWKVDKTNWADLNITIKLHGSVTNTYLLISNNDATFATIDQELLINADSTITLGSDLIPDGAYFTFGKEILGPGYVNTNIVTWQRADDGISTSDNWNDFSGNDNNATQATVADQPQIISGASSNAINFNPGYRFTTAVEWFDYNNNLTLSGTGNKTVLWVAKSFAATGAAQAVVSHSNTGTNLFLTYLDNSNRPGVAVGGGGSTCAPVSPSAVSFNVPLIGTFNRTSTTSSNMYTNGGFLNTSTCNSNFVGQNMRIGARSSTGFQPFNGNIAEVVVYDRSLTTVEMERAHSYLALKYGITLDQGVATDYVATDWNGTTGTKMWTAADNGIYNKNIAGIGRDDKTALYQKQSRSVSDTLITIAAGSAVAADNLSNTASIDDLSFFTWADDGGAATFTVAVTGVPNATSRMSRVWKADKTNWTDQDITIKTAPGGERYLLVHATDPTFGAGTIEYAINTGTSSVTINSANLPDGAYFTIATKIVGPACVNNGIVAWLRADYGATVNSWADFSGNQINAAQATGANQPALLADGLNYNAALQFNGTSDYMQIPQASITGKFPAGNAARTVIGVGTSAAATDQILMSYGAFVTNQASGLRKNTVLAAIVEVGGPNNVVAPANSFLSNKTGIISGRYTGSATGNASVYMNDTSALASGVRNWATTITAEGAQIGKYVGEVRFWNGNIGEVIVYNRDLTNDELLRVNSYLALKYGITLNQTIAKDYVASDGTTRMWTAAENIGYNRRITGIGRDDCTELYQKQSLSVDTGIVAIAIGDDVDTANAANINTIGNDNSYFVFADDGNSLQYNTAISGLGNLTARMDRIWKVDKTNWADADVTFRLTGGNDKIYMVVSAGDAVFDGSDAVYQLNVDGNVTVPSDQLPDGAYFTFAKQLRGPAFVNLGIRVWLDANDELTAITDGFEWQDRSGNDLHVSQITDAREAIMGVTDSSSNYNATVDFDGDDVFETDQQVLRSATSDGTVFFVSKYRDLTGYDSPVDFDADDPHLGRLNASVGAYKVGSTPVEYFPGGNQTLTINKTHLSGFIWGGGTNGGIELRRDAASSVNTTMDFNNIAYTQNFGVGAYISGAEGINGTMSEVIVYDRKLTSPEANMVESYLALKYGTTLDQTIPTHYTASDGTTRMWDASGGDNATYKNNIAGIGRDDNGNLYQKQSRSINSISNGNMIAIGLDNIVGANKDNIGTFADDLSFLVWGDDGLTSTRTTEYPVTLNPGGCSRITRLQREWKVQKTGTVGNVQMLVYLAGQVPSSTTASDLRLLIDDDGDFSSGSTTIIEVSSYNAVTQVATFNDISLNNGQYFTLVTDLTNEAPGGVLSNLYTWYRADKGITATTTVSGWTDQSATPKNLAGAIGTQPVYNTSSNLINFNPTLGFDGTNDVLSHSAISHSAAANGEEFFAVVLPNSVPAGFHDIIGLGTLLNTNTATELRYNNNRLEHLSNNGTAQSVFNPATSNGLVQLANAHRPGSGPDTLLLNGSRVASGTMTQLPSANYLNIGARRAAAANSFFFNGQIAEVAIYNRKLDATERKKLSSYFAIKYGITLPHDYMSPDGIIIWDSTLNNGYHYNIAGISRDDCNGLHQKQSKSINTTEALITLGNGLGILTTNAANTNVLENNTALVLGDDNGNRTTWTATGAPANRERIARTWKVQETGNIGTVTIQVPANSSADAVKLPLERDGTMYLLVNNSSDFTSGATETAMLLNGTNWEVTYDFNSGDYITFATLDECNASDAVLTLYNAETTAAANKCYVNEWILFRDPLDAGKYIAAIYDPGALINRTLITARVDVNTAFADLGEGNSSQASRLMRRMLQIDCNSCYDAVANPNPNFIVRMFYAPTEKTDAESVETNNMIEIKTSNSITDQHFFKWFKAADKTVNDVVTGLSPGGIHADGQEWADGTLPTGQIGGVDYVDFTNVNSFSTFGGIWAVNVLNVLPVTWLNVEAVPSGDHIQIKWSTAGEINNTGFVVERSVDGQNYQAIAAVASQSGNTGSPSYYSVDDNTVEKRILYYYRIKQADFGGHVSYSKVVTARLSVSNMNVLRIRPNPVSGVLRWEYQVSVSQDCQTEIVDITGRVLGKMKVHAQAGVHPYTMDISRLSRGTYLLRITGKDGSVQTEKFIIP